MLALTQWLCRRRKPSAFSEGLGCRPNRWVRYRENLKRGVVVALVPVGPEVVELLIATVWLAERRRRAKLGFSVWHPCDFHQ